MSAGRTLALRLMTSAVMIASLGTTASARAPSVQSAASGQPSALRPSFLVTSPDYEDLAFLKKRQAASERDCGGLNLSPALHWSGEPSKATSFAVMFYDPDGVFGQSETKWIGYNIPTTVHALAEGAMSASAQNMSIGVNDHGEAAYYGPCPPYGTRHHYVFGVYALDLPVGSIPAGLDRPGFLKAIRGHTLAYQSIVLSYQRALPANGVIPPWHPRRAAGGQ